MTKKRAYLLFFLLALILILVAYYFYLREAKFDYKDLTIVTPSDFYDYEYNKSILKSSFDNHFIKDLLPVTNLIVLDDKHLASGDDKLSESLGLMMQLAVKNNDKDLFDSYIDLMDEKFTKSNSLLRWRISEKMDGEGLNTVNASVDDLRIVKVLFEASAKWNDDEYASRANIIGNSLLLNCVSDDMLLSYDDKNSPEAILTYYDFKAMLLLSEHQNQWKKVISKGIQSVRESQVDQLPFYYIEDNNYKSIENLLILMHLYEVGYEQPEAIKFIEHNIKNGGYYSKYDSFGNPVEIIESPAIYGIIAQIAKLADDRDLYQMSCEKLILLQNTESSTFHGGFVNDKTLEGYSFDHLMALLGF